MNINFQKNTLKPCCTLAPNVARVGQHSICGSLVALRSPIFRRNLINELRYRRNIAYAETLKKKNLPLNRAKLGVPLKAERKT